MSSTRQGQRSSGRRESGPDRRPLVRAASKALLLVAFGAAFGVSACDEDDPVLPRTEPPTVATGTVHALGRFGATLEGTIDTNGAETFYWYEFGEKLPYAEVTEEDTLSAEPPGPRLVFGTLGELIPETRYHYRLAARNAGGTSYGADDSFTTLRPNRAPDTALTAAGSDTVASQVHWHLFWYGTDVDGVVVRYEWRMIDHGADGSLDPADSSGVAWASTTWTDTLFTWADGLGSRTFFVRAVDDEEGRDPSPASRTVEASGGR